MDMLLSSIKCGNCKHVLDSPIILPCGDSICQKHTTESQGPILCHTCGIEHQIPVNGGFIHVKALSGVIKSQIADLDFGKEHNEAKQSCQRFDDLLTQIDDFLKDPYNFTYEAIEYLKNVVQLKGEEIIFKTNENMHRLIRKLDEYKQECKSDFRKSEYVTKSENFANKKENARKELNVWYTTLNGIKFDWQECERIKRECYKAVELFKNKLEGHKFDLFPSQFDEFASEIEKGFGEFDIDPIFGLKLDSKIILNFSMKNDLFKLCEFISSQRLNLLYRGSLHGFGASDFHSKCDNISKTLTIVKAESGNIFGGYTEAMWESTRNEITKSDKSAFIFSLVNKENNPVKVNIASGKKSRAIFCNKQFGPSFGHPDVTDILINNDCNLSCNSLCNFGHNYVLQNYPGGSDKAENFLAGSFEFKVEEIEVFQLY